jgi:hypothetical protein
MVTAEELYGGIDDEGRKYTKISSELTGTWKWGTWHDVVYRRECDETYWLMQYRVESQEGIDLDSAEVTQVRPVEETVVVTKWKPV